jgi:multiple sugar transport system permease protein
VSVTAPIPLAERPTTARLRRASGRRRGRRLALHALLIFVAVAWLFPLAWAAYTSLRPFAETATRGYVSLPGTLTLDNYAVAWRDGELLGHFLVSLAIVGPSVVAVLGLASALAFVASRFSWRWNVALLLFFTCGNLLPPHALITPLWQLYLTLPVPPPLSDNGVLFDQVLGLIVINVAFQVGFATFVLSAFMRAVPGEVLEAARLDGASLGRLLWSVMLPLVRPALAALAVLEATWIYNDFLWALALTQTTARRPVTSALANLSGEFFTDYNVVAAASILVALPTVLLFLAGRRHLKRGLTLGASSG